MNRVNPFDVVELFDVFDRPVQLTMDRDVSAEGDVAIYAEPRKGEYVTFDPSQLETKFPKYDVCAFTRDGVACLEFLLHVNEDDTDD